MKLQKRFACITALIVALSALAGCSSGSADASDSLPPVSSSQQSTLQTNEARSMVRVGALQGPTGLGLVGLMEKNEQKEANNVYEFTLAGAPDEITGKLVSGELDIASVPTNVAATLYAKTEGKVTIIGVNTLGVLYLLHKPADGEEAVEITGFADLAGQTIHTSGQGATQEYVLNYLLEQSGAAEAEVVYYAEHAELATLMLEGRAEYALLPQPFVTSVTARDETVEVALDVTEQWQAVTGSRLPMGCVVVRSDFLEKNQSAVDQFLEELAESVEYVNGNVQEAAELAEKFDVITAVVAGKAIPQCNIVCLTGAEMQDAVVSYLDILEAANPKSVGGSLPDEAFYYIP